jgi:hypothetical protein
MGKQYCPFEGEYVADRLVVVDGTLVHDVEPPHRVTDGMTVELTADRRHLVVVVQEAVEAMADEMPEQD